MQIYAEKLRDTRTLLKYAKKCGNKRNMRNKLPGRGLGRSPTANAFVGHFEPRKHVWWQQN